LGHEIFVLLTSEIFLGGKCIKRAIYALIIWEGSGTKFFWHLTWENVFSGYFLEWVAL